MKKERKAKMPDYGIFDDASEDGNLKKAISIAAFILICCCLVIAVMQSAWKEESASMNSSLNSSCPSCPECIDNFTTYDIPAELPNMSAIVKDPLCNDFCYVQACRYGCSQWINLGLMDGRCQCDLQECIIHPSDIYGSNQS